MIKVTDCYDQIILFFLILKNISIYTLKNYKFIEIICSHDSCGMLGDTEYDGRIFLLYLSEFFHVHPHVILAM